ncbi:His-Xaa-Ser system protein HxsD [Pseudomonas stutzeri]|nr:His-Xaa-Ser system protein HxsD [Stutzerimonas stutzeri]
MQWSAVISIDSATYPLSVVQKSAYVLADSLSILIRQTSDEFVLTVEPSDPSAALTEAAARVVLTRTLNDFALRDQVFKETAGIREILARTALKGAGF